jgi:hypothetical protein
VSTPGTSSYRHYIAKDEFASKFGPTQVAVKAVERYLRNSGLPPGHLAGDRLSISLTASAGQLSKAFATSFDLMRLPGGRLAVANTEPPLFPGPVAGYVQGVIGLDTVLQEQPLDAAGATVGRPSRSSASVRTSGPLPCKAARSDASANGAFTANQLASAYDFSSLYEAGDEGSGISVAVYELASTVTADIAAYQSCYRTHVQVRYTKVDGFNETGDSVAEPTLDIEDVIGLAPKASIHVYEAPNTSTGAYDNYKAIFDDDTADVVSVSWGACESAAGSSDIAEQLVLFEQAAAQGQSVLAAAGDSGSEACLQANSSDTSLSVQDPASDPYVTGVGGTTISALGPPPTQSVWNHAPNGGAGGGGVSAVHLMPTYQSGAVSSLNVINSDSSGSPCKAGTGNYCREVPDVSADASPNSGYVIYLDGNWTAIGGTSAAAPLWAAFTALADASGTCDGTSIGFANPDLYAAASTAYSSDFDDITQGDNDYTGTNRGLYPATAGYDMASGLGTPIGGPLAATICSFTSASNPGTLYASPSPEGAGTCAAPSDACTLGQALLEETPRSTIALAAGNYVGTWTISRAVTLEGASESSTTLDGDDDGTVLQSLPKSGATVSIEDLTIENGQGSSCKYASSGGGICVVAGSLAVTDTAFVDNTAPDGSEGGAISNGGTGTITVTSSTFTDDSAPSILGWGGAIYNGGGQLVVSDSTFSGDTAGFGGAIFIGGGTAVISDTTFSGNSSSDGGAIANGDNHTKGTLSVGDSSFVDNTAPDVGYGGAIDNGGSGGQGTATIADSSFAGNSAGWGGGAINNAGDGTGWLTVNDSTFTNNASGTADKQDRDGGAIDNGDDTGVGTAAVTSSTFEDNSPDGTPALANAQHGHSASTLALAADILVGATSGPGTTSMSSECRGKLTDDGYNVSDDATCHFTKTTSVSVSETIQTYLGPLGDYGGSTDTIPLLASYASPPSGDPAYGTVSPSADTLKIVGSTVESTSTTICSTHDQRGDKRQASGCDMGPGAAGRQSLSRPQARRRSSVKA